MKVINVQNAKTHLSRLIDEAAAGGEIVIGKHGKPMVRLSSYAPRKERWRLGGLEEKIRIAPDFDEEGPRINRLFNQDS